MLGPFAVISCVISLTRGANLGRTSGDSVVYFCFCSLDGVILLMGERVNLSTSWNLDSIPFVTQFFVVVKMRDGVSD